MKQERNTSYQKLIDQRPQDDEIYEGPTSTFVSSNPNGTTINHIQTVGGYSDIKVTDESSISTPQIAPAPARPPKSILVYYSCQQCTLLTLGMIFLLGSLVVEFAVPYYSAIMISLADKSKTDDHAWFELKMYGLYLGIIVLGSAASTFFRGISFQLASQRIARNMRRDLYKAILSQEVGYFDENKTGGLISRMSSDITVIQDGLSVNVAIAVRGITFVVGALILLGITSWQLTLGLFAVLLPVMIYTVGLGNIMKKIQEQMQDSKAIMTSTSQEAIANIRTVKAFSTEDYEIDKFNQGNNGVYKIGLKRVKVYSGFLFGIIAFMWGCVVGVLLFGGWLVRNDKLESHQVTYFIVTLIQLLLNFMMLAEVFGAVMKVRGAATKLAQILSREPSINHSGGKIPPSSRGDIELKNVSFSYPSKPNIKVLKDLNLNVKQGMVVALVGPSGGGKSSVVSIIERFYDPLAGSIQLDGINVRELNPSWYHRQVSLVQQEPVLFSGSIRENIAYGVDVTEQEMLEAAKMANAYNFITDKVKFPQGFDTVVGERGVLLSGGQKQRIAIARALVRKPKVLVLDEATSALDAESEHLVQQALDNLIAQTQQTVILIAHRLSTVKDADLIVVINKGEIVEVGKHEQLLERGGQYAQLVHHQLENH